MTDSHDTDSPDRVSLLIGFLNTIDIEARTDLLDSPEDYADWARQQGHDLGDVRSARRIRDALRAELRGQHAAAAEFAIPVRLEPAGAPRLYPRSAAEAALTAAVELAAAGQWKRVKLCPADDCLEAFYDNSRNRSRIWCNMADCGNLAKVRTHRQRAGAATSP